MPKGEGDLDIEGECIGKKISSSFSPQFSSSSKGKSLDNKSFRRKCKGVCEKNGSDSTITI